MNGSRSIKRWAAPGGAALAIILLGQVTDGSSATTPTPQEVARLRALGPPGVDAFAERHAGALAQPDPPEAVRTALDRLCAQRDCHASRLYWYTDFQRARQAAAEQDKPILSLRLLGDLDDEYSCANSRYFRTALYANAAISGLLRERFVLHWESVRPVPVLTVDMGDGRELRRTLTGNSIHYVLDSAGRPRDALPGLYGPRAFGDSLRRVLETFEEASRHAPEHRDSVWHRYHRTRLAHIGSVWRKQLHDPGPRVDQANGGAQSAGRFIDAYTAGRLTLTKAAVEIPLFTGAFDEFSRYQRASDEDFWNRIAALYAESARLDESSRRLLAAKLRRGPATAGRSRDVAATVAEFESRMAQDSVRNELLLHRRIHEWLCTGGPDSLDELNERVYAELFLTPSTDDWLGLVPQHAYAALDGGGIRRGTD